MVSLSTIQKSWTTDATSRSRRPAVRSLLKVRPERPRGERPLTKFTYPLKTSSILMKSIITPDLKVLFSDDLLG